MVQGLDFEEEHEDDLEPDEVAALHARVESPSEVDVAQALRHVIVTIPRDVAIKRVDVMINGEPDAEFECGVDDRMFDFTAWTPVRAFEDFAEAWYRLRRWPDRFDYLFAFTYALNPPHYSWLEQLEADWPNCGGKSMLSTLAMMWAAVLHQVGFMYANLPLPPSASVNDVDGAPKPSQTTS
jgi:hypothetical protein